MRKIKIKSLRMSDWKAQNREVFFNDGITTISGKNGTGKSSVYKAFCWLLTGYTDPINVKNHELFDSSVELTQDTPVAVVSAVFDIDGTEVKIERSAKAAFRRERGTDFYVKAASDSYIFRIDDVEVSATDFNSFISDHFIYIDFLPYAIMGERFANLANTDKVKARKLLELIVGTISINDINKHDYSSIKLDVEKYGIDVLKERYKGLMKPYKQRLVEIEAILAVRNEDLRKYNAIDFYSLEKERESIEAELSDIEHQMMGATEKNEPKRKLRDGLVAQIHQLSTKLGDMRIEYDNAQKAKEAELRTLIASVDKENAAIKEANEKAAKAYDDNSKAIDDISVKISVLNSKREELIQKRTKVKELVFDGEYCRFCGAKLNADKLEEAKKQFSEEKQSKLNDIIMEGLSVRKEIDALTEELNKRTDVKNKGFHVEGYKSAEEQEASLRNFLESKVPFEDTGQYKNVCSEIDELKSKLPVINDGDAELIAKRTEANNRFKEVSMKLGEKVAMNNVKEHIRLLNVEYKEAASKIAEYEGMIDLVNKFIEERANVISERINDRLEECKIVMYSRQKDGELKPDCVIKDMEDIPYATMNNSARIKTCLAIQRMLCEHFEVIMPLFVDEYAIFDSEHAPKSDWQQINLCASDTQFKVE